MAACRASSVIGTGIEMSGLFYTHRLTKLLEEFVLGAGLTIVISDETSHVSLSDQLANIEQAAQKKGIVVRVENIGDRTVIQFQKG
ncbi:MAG: hypothetical protein AAFR60_07080 [Pseudomonadota bacterium]